MRVVKPLFVFGCSDPTAYVRTCFSMLFVHFGNAFVDGVCESAKVCFGMRSSDHLDAENVARTFGLYTTLSVLLKI